MTLTTSSTPNNNSDGRPDLASSTVLIVFDLDSSGSMHTIKPATINSTNAFIASQDPKQNPDILDQSTKIGILQFSSADMMTWMGASEGINPSEGHFQPIADFNPLTETSYDPIGATALFDSIHYCISSVDRYISDHPEESVMPIVVIQTDGHENASTFGTMSSVRDLITARTEAGWKFTFLGANQDACLTASSLGVARHASLSYAATAEGMGPMSEVLSAAVTRLRSADDSLRTPDVSYSELERQSQTI